MPEKHSPSDSAKPIKNDKSKYQAGHRKRLKEAFLTKKEPASEAELLEMILYLHHPRADVKPMVKDLLKQYKSIRNFIMASEDKESFLETNSSGLFFVAKLIREVTLKSLITEVEDGTALSSWSAMIKYLQLRFGPLTKECFSVVYLNTHYKIIDIVEFGSGTIDESVVYTREIVKTGLQKGSSNIILCHNHPSDTTTPSAADISITKSILTACRAVEISVIDHVIVSRNGFFSFKANKLLD